MKKNFKKIKDRIAAGVGTFMGTTAMLSANVMPVYASSTGVGEIDTSLTVIKVLGIGICESVGIIVIIKGGMEFGSAFSQRDSTGMQQGAAIIGGGLIMGFIGAIIGLLGF